MKSEKLVNPTPRILTETLQSLPEEMQDLPIMCHSMGNGIEVSILEHYVSLVGFHEHMTGSESKD